jgi:hypothetical protein
MSQAQGHARSLSCQVQGAGLSLRERYGDRRDASLRFTGGIQATVNMLKTGPVRNATRMVGVGELYASGCN